MNQGGFKEGKGFQLGHEAKCGSKPGGESLGRVSEKRESRSAGLELRRKVTLCATCHTLSLVFLVIRSRYCYSCLREREFLFWKEKIWKIRDLLKITQVASERQSWNSKSGLSTSKACVSTAAFHSGQWEVQLKQTGQLELRLSSWNFILDAFSGFKDFWEEERWAKQCFKD